MNVSKTASVALALTAALGAGTAGAAGSNPFGLAELDGGYMLLADASGGDKTGAEGKCGEGKCGADKAAAEGKCGEGKCGADKKASSEGKCGEGKCGGAK